MWAQSRDPECQGVLFGGPEAGEEDDGTFVSEPTQGTETGRGYSPGR